MDLANTFTNKSKYLIIIQSLITVMYIGGVNWLMTAIKSFYNNNKRVDDIFYGFGDTDSPNTTEYGQMFVNIVYILVFIASLLFSLIWSYILFKINDSKLILSLLIFNSVIIFISIATVIGISIAIANEVPTFVDYAN